MNSAKRQRIAEQVSATMAHPYSYGRGSFHCADVAELIADSEQCERLADVLRQVRHDLSEGMIAEAESLLDLALSTNRAATGAD